MNDTAPKPTATTASTTTLSLNRRSFLAASTLALAGGPYHGALTRAAQDAATPPSAKVRLGLIGVGGMGLGDLASFFMNPEVECPIVCDVDDKRIGDAVAYVEKARGKRPDTTKDFRRVIDRQDIDAVLIATPDHWHALPTVLACQAGKDVYVEKPLATTIDEGRAMLTAAQRHDRIVQMGTQWRHSTSYAQAVDYVRSGKLGPVSLVHVWVYLDWIGDIGTPADAPVPAGVDYDMWLGPAPQRRVQSQPVSFQLPLVLGLRRRADDGLGRAHAEHRVLGTRPTGSPDDHFHRRHPGDEGQSRDAGHADHRLRVP